MKKIFTACCFIMFASIVYSQNTENAIYFPQSGAWTDNLPIARLYENWGMRFGVATGTHVFSVASSLVVGYPMNGYNWGIGNIYGSGSFALGTTSPRGRFDVDGPGDIYLADEVNGNGTAQSIFLPGHIYLAPFAGNDVALLQARRQNDSGNVGMRLRTTNNGVVTEAIQIQPNGSIGVGLLTPNTQSKLHVYEPGSSASTWRGRIVASGATQAVVMGEFDGKAYLAGHTPTLDNWSDLIINMGGRVGIGTSSPTQKVEIVGAGSTTVDLKVKGRIQTGDSFNAGGVWLNQAGTMLVGQQGATSIGFYNNGQWRLTADNSGNVGIGTTSPDQKLTVKGKIHAEEVLIDLSVPAPDYVFEKNYSLTPLDTLQAYIAQHKHLPEVPSAKEIEKDGLKVGEMEMILLKKIEELTLYVIELKTENKSMKNKNEELKRIILERISALENTTKK